MKNQKDNKIVLLIGLIIVFLMVPGYTAFARDGDVYHYSGSQRVPMSGCNHYQYSDPCYNCNPGYEYDYYYDGCYDPQRDYYYNCPDCYSYNYDYDYYQYPDCQSYDCYDYQYQGEYGSCYDYNNYDYNYNYNCCPNYNPCHYDRYYVMFGHFNCYNYAVDRLHQISNMGVPVVIVRSDGYFQVRTRYMYSHDRAEDISENAQSHDYEAYVDRVR
jgi:hypothetical protein